MSSEVLDVWGEPVTIYLWSIDLQVTALFCRQLENLNTKCRSKIKLLYLVKHINIHMIDL